MMVGKSKISGKKIGGLICGIASLVIILSVLYQWINGMEVGYNEIIAIGVSLSAFFSAITWGSIEDGDGPTQKEELGQYITQKSAKISYFILVVVMFVLLFVDQMVTHTENITLMIALMLAIVILPATEFVISRRYR
jgi:uncharacterized membrane protein